MQKYFTQSIAILFLFCFCSCRQKKEPDKFIPVNISFLYLKANVDSILKCDSTICYHVTVTLENRGLLNIRYYSWFCSWTQDFITDNNNFEIEQNLCFSNWYFIGTIPTLEKITIPLVIRKLNRQQNDAFRIGFMYINPDLVTGGEYLYMPLKERMKKIKWSYSVTGMR